MKKLFSLLLVLLFIFCLSACHNPIKEAVTGGETEIPPVTQEPVPQEEPAPIQQPEEPTVADSADDSELRAQLLAVLEEKLGKNDPATGDEYSYSLGDRVSDKAGREYFFARWVRIIYDLDSNSKVPSLLAELFITPDGSECFIGNYFPDNAGNGETVVLTTGNIFDPAAGFVMS